MSHIPILTNHKNIIKFIYPFECHFLYKALAQSENSHLYLAWFALTATGNAILNNPDSGNVGNKLIAHLPLDGFTVQPTYRQSVTILPNEILVNIMTCSPNFLVLASFVVAFPEIRDLACSSGKEIFARTLLASRSSEVGRLVIAVIALRHCEYFEEHAGMEVASMVRDERCPYYKNAENNAPGRYSPFRPLLDPEDPMSVLLDIAMVSKSIESLVDSFAEKRVLGPSAAKSLPLSPTEAIRIRRALWSFQICFELSHLATARYSSSRTRQILPRSPLRFYMKRKSRTLSSPASDAWLYQRYGDNILKFSPSDLVYGFLRKVSTWEIDELEAVRFHLIAETNALQYSRSRAADVNLTQQPVLLLQLLHDLHYWEPAGLYPSDPVLVTDMEFKRHPSSVSIYWPENGEANFPNSDIAKRAHLSVKPDDEKWGLCMWDEKRFRERSLLGHNMAAYQAKNDCRESQRTAIERWIEAKWVADVSTARGAKEMRRREEQEATERSRKRRKCERAKT